MDLWTSKCCVNLSVKDEAIILLILFINCCQIVDSEVNHFKLFLLINSHRWRVHSSVLVMLRLLLSRSLFA